MSEDVIPVQDKLRSWAQNEEMIDQYYTEHGEDCDEAAELIDYYEDQNVLLLKETERLRKYCKEWAEANQKLRAVLEAAREVVAAVHPGQILPIDKLAEALRACDEVKP